MVILTGMAEKTNLFKQHMHKSNVQARSKIFSFCLQSTRGSSTIDQLRLSKLWWQVVICVESKRGMAFVETHCIAIGYVCFCCD